MLSLSRGVRRSRFKGPGGVSTRAQGTSTTDPSARRPGEAGEGRTDAILQSDRGPPPRQGRCRHGRRIRHRRRDRPALRRRGRPGRRRRHRRRRPATSMQRRAGRPGRRPSAATSPPRPRWTHSSPRATTAFGALDAAFNVAGASRPALIVDMTEEDWDFTVDLCLKGVFFGVKHEARQMIDAGPRAGAIVNIASLNSRVPMFFGVGLLGGQGRRGHASGRPAALELGEHGIRVTTVSPGLTATPLVAPMTEPAGGQHGLHGAHPAEAPGARPRTSPRPRCSWPATRPRTSPASTCSSTAAGSSPATRTCARDRRHHRQRGDGALVMTVGRATRWVGGRRHLRGSPAGAGLRPARPRPQRSRRLRRSWSTSSAPIGARHRLRHGHVRLHARPAGHRRHRRRSGAAPASTWPAPSPVPRRCAGCTATPRRCPPRGRRRVHDRQRRPGLPHRRRLGRHAARHPAGVAPGGPPRVRDPRPGPPGLGAVDAGAHPHGRGRAGHRRGRVLGGGHRRRRRPGDVPVDDRASGATMSSLESTSTLRFRERPTSRRRCAAKGSRRSRSVTRRTGPAASWCSSPCARADETDPPRGPGGPGLRPRPQQGFWRGRVASVRRAAPIAFRIGVTTTTGP